MSKKIFFYFFLFLISLCVSVKLPETFKKCSQNSTECLRGAVEGILVQLVEPMKHLGLPNLEPLLIPAMSIAPGTGPTQFQQNYKNMKIYGLSKSKVSYVVPDAEKMTLSIKWSTAELKLTFNYTIQGKVLILPIVGDGPGIITMDDSEFTYDSRMEEYVKKGSKHYRVFDFTLKMSPKGIHFQLDNLFNGDKRMGDSINQVLNDNWEPIFNDVKGGYEEALGQVLTNVINNFFAKVPISEMFVL